MDLSRLMSETVVIERQTETLGTDGSTAQTWTTSSTVKGFVNDHGGAKQYRNGTDVIISDASGFFPSGTSILINDRIKTANGRYYRVIYVKAPGTAVTPAMPWVAVELEYDSQLKA